MKRFILIIFLCFLTLPSYADMILQGEVKYNVDSARQELTTNQPQKVNEFLIRTHYVDINHQENMTHLLKGNVILKDRELAFFSDETYGVIYNSNKLQVFYYRPDGQLMNVELRDKLTYPYKSYKYNISGELVNMGLRVSKAETFIYTPQGELIAHWVKNLGYDNNGRIIMTRKYAN